MHPTIFHQNVTINVLMYDGIFVENIYPSIMLFYIIYVTVFELNLYYVNGVVSNMLWHADSRRDRILYSTNFGFCHSTLIIWEFDNLWKPDYSHHVAAKWGRNIAACLIRCLRYEIVRRKI